MSATLDMSQSTLERIRQDLVGLKMPRSSRSARMASAFEPLSPSNTLCFGPGSAMTGA